MSHCHEYTLLSEFFWLYLIGLKTSFTTRGALPLLEAVASQDIQIEVGADGDSLRYWQAKEAMRHAELRLVSQAAAVQALEARSTSILGWILAILTTVASAALIKLNGGHAVFGAALCLAFIPALIAVAAAAGAIWPKAWCVPGYEPSVVASECENELQQIEFLVCGYGRGIEENAQFLSLAGKRMCRAWWCLMLTPLTAVVAGLIASAAGY